jgi:hypothetical protein
MFKRLFVDHPDSVGESYFEHLQVAFGFGFQMVAAGLACIVHGLVPGCFKNVGSTAITCLNDRLMAKRCQHNIIARDQIAIGVETAVNS